MEREFSGEFVRGVLEEIAGGGAILDESGDILIASNSEWEDFFRRRSKDGSGGKEIFKERDKFYHLKKEPISAGANSDYTLMMAEDITEKEKLSARLGRFQEFLDDVLDLMSDHVLIIDTDFNIRFMDSDLEEKINIKNPEKCHEIFGRETPCQNCPRKALNQGRSLTGKNVERRSEEKIFMATSLVKKTGGKEPLLVELLEDLTEKRIHRAAIKYSSYHDKLTGLYNRTYMGKEIERLDTKRQLPISVIMVDVRDLQSINKKHGHGVGDELLLNTSDLLRESIRSEDILSRWSGDDFLILLPQTSREEAIKVGSRIAENSKNLFSEGDLLNLGIGLAVKMHVDQDIYGIIYRAEDNMDRRDNENF